MLGAEAKQNRDNVADNLCKQSYLELNVDWEGWSGAVSVAGGAALGLWDRRLQSRAVASVRFDPVDRREPLKVIGQGSGGN